MSCRLWVRAWRVRAFENLFSFSFFSLVLFKTFFSARSIRFSRLPRACLPRALCVIFAFVFHSATRAFPYFSYFTRDARISLCRVTHWIFGPSSLNSRRRGKHNPVSLYLFFYSRAATTAFWCFWLESRKSPETTNKGSGTANTLWGNATNIIKYLESHINKKIL